MISIAECHLTRIQRGSQICQSIRQSYVWNETAVSFPAKLYFVSVTNTIQCLALSPQTVITPKDAQTTNHGFCEVSAFFPVSSWCANLSFSVSLPLFHLPWKLFRSITSTLPPKHFLSSSCMSGDSHLFCSEEAPVHQQPFASLTLNMQRELSLFHCFVSVWWTTTFRTFHISPRLYKLWMLIDVVGWDDVAAAFQHKQLS